MTTTGTKGRASVIDCKPLTRGNAGAPGGIRTPNLLIRSQMLYPLSHGCRLRRRSSANV